MATELHIKDSSDTWRKLTQIHIKDSSDTWRNLKELWIKGSDDVWRRVFNSIVITVPSGTVDHTVGAPTDANALISFGSDGSISYGAGNTTPGMAQWGTPTSGGLGSGYVIRASISGTAVNYPGSAATDNSWISLGTAVLWGQRVTGVGARTCTLAIQISGDGGATIIASGSVTINAEAA